MDRKSACLAQAAMCRDRAETDPSHHDYWVDRAIRWLEQARALRTPTEDDAVRSSDSEQGNRRFM